MDHGLPALSPNTQLNDIATAHSRDMIRSGYVGHRSPTTGMLSDRLSTAQFWSVAHGENVALNSSIWDAQAGLMESLGHRKNILSPNYTEVGIGVVHGPKGWFVTQVFSRPAAKRIDAADAKRFIYERFNKLRRGHSDADVTPHPSLSLAAQTEAETGQVSLVQAIDRSRADGYLGELAGWSTKLAELTHFEIPEEFNTTTLRSIGIGVHHMTQAPPPNIQIVILIGRE